MPVTRQGFIYERNVLVTRPLSDVLSASGGGITIRDGVFNDLPFLTGSLIYVSAAAAVVTTPCAGATVVSSFYRNDYIISAFSTSLFQFPNTAGEQCNQAPFSMGIRGARSLRARTDPYVCIAEGYKTNVDKSSWDKQQKHSITGTSYPLGRR